MIRPFGLQDIWLVRRLQRSGVSLAIEHMLTHPHQPLWMALTAPWPWAGLGAATFVLDERVGDERAGDGGPDRRSAFVQLVQRANRPEADVLHIAPALRISPSGEYLNAGAWQRLLDHCTLSAASHGVQRLYAGAAAGSVEQDFLKQLGFCRYAHETIFRLPGAPPPGGSLVGFRPQRPQDSWALQRLYVRTTPRLVQQSEGAARHEAVAGGPLFSWWEPDDWQGVIWEPAGEMRGAAQVHLGRRGHWLRVWGASELSGRELRALVEQGLGLIHRARGRGTLRRSLRRLNGAVAAGPSAPVYISVRDYESGLAAVLTGFGFSPFMDRARFVKHTVALVREPALMPAATRELRREVSRPVGTVRCASNTTRARSGFARAAQPCD